MSCSAEHPLPPAPMAVITYDQQSTVCDGCFQKHRAHLADAQGDLGMLNAEPSRVK